MTQRDLQELELAARMIIAVIERNHVSDEDATERRAKFILFPGGEKEKSPAVTTGGEKKKKNTALSFTSQEMEEMPNELKKLFITGAIIAHVRKNRGAYEIRVQINRKRLSASGKKLDIAKIRFLQKLKEYERLNFVKDSTIFRNIARRAELNSRASCTTYC